MKLNNSLFRIGFALATALAIATFSGAPAQGQAFHGAGILKTPVGPDGTPHARTGELVRATITVMNSDEFVDTLTITSIYDVIHHWNGDEVSSNLLAAPITLVSPLAFGTNSVDVVCIYRVRPGDENLPSGLLLDDARADGFDNHDGIGATLLRQSFFVTFPGQVRAETNACVPTCATGAWSDPTYRPSNKPPGRNQAFWARGISTNLIFYPQPGSWIENSDGTAQLSGTLRSQTNLSSGFTVTMTLTGRQSNPPPGSPNPEMDPSAYIQNGGPINPATWYYYTNFTGTLIGFGFWQDAVITFKRDPASSAFQVGVGANGKNTRFGATGWWNWTVVHQPSSGNLPTQTIVANINLDLLCCQPSTIGDFVWQDLNQNGVQDAGEPGVPNATVRLLDCTNQTAVLASTTTDANGLYQFGNLMPGSYLVQFVAPSGYRFTLPFQGGDITRDSDANQTTGLSQCVTLSSNDMNLTIDAGLISNCVPSCVIAAWSDPTYRPSTKPPGRNQAVWMRDISTNLIFSPNAGSWVENSDGTAQMTGTVRSLTNMTSGFTVVLNLSGRQTAVPSGSPKLELDPAAYVQNGGPLDPAKWYYYTSSSGTLTGFGYWQGAVLSLTRMGPAFQVGVGANGKNQDYGASAWFIWTVTKQPTSTPKLPTTGQADFTVDLICCP